MNQLDSNSQCEEWKPIVGFNGIYSISSFGRVKSEPHIREIIRNNKVIFQKRRGQILKASKGKYLKVNLAYKGKVTTKNDIHW